jgi:3-hydroxyanthranilate 3,4-dioxygenase
MASPILCNVGKWIQDNEQFFLPPVCNKLMHGDGQANVMFVGGPNDRRDYHIEGGEELFYQIKGDMLLKVVEQNRHRDIKIKEGEVFLLPRAIPHSPQRFANTVGLVMERSRLKTELDGLRFHVVSENGIQTTESLYECWFQWNENRARMAEFFDEFFASEQFKTGKPVPGVIPDKSPIEIDSQTSLGDPFSLKDWIATNRQQIDADGKLAVFDRSKHQLQVFIYGRGENTDCAETAETWIWQMEGESRVKVGSHEFALNNDDSLLVPVGLRFTVTQKLGSVAFVCYQVPNVS